MEYLGGPAVEKGIRELKKLAYHLFGNPFYANEIISRICTREDEVLEGKDGSSFRNTYVFRIAKRKE